MDSFQHLEHFTSAERIRLHSAPIVVAAMQGNVNRKQYLQFLTRAFHHVRHTAPLLMACGSRLSYNHEWLRAAVSHYVEEELGHHEWILNDISAAGGNADAVRNSEPDFDTEVLIAYAYDIVTRRNPVGFLGMVYVLEGTSVALASKAAGALGNALDLPPEAFTYLASHGALDVQHIGHFEHLVNRLDQPADCQAIEHCANAVFQLYGNVLRGIPLETAQ